MVTHIFKDGTVRTDLTDVHIPAALMEEVVSIVRRKNVQKSNDGDGAADCRGDGGRKQQKRKS